MIFGINHLLDKYEQEIRVRTIERRRKKEVEGINTFRREDL